ncbi:MAG: hypothetical protein ACREQJ_05370, partial [Candidatus Binatia bacterium]
MGWIRALVAMVVVAAFVGGPVEAFIKCQMPDGRLLFVDVPPAGCEVKSELRNAPDPVAPAEGEQVGGGDGREEGAADSGSEGSSGATGSSDAQAIASARRIERELASAADELDRVRQDRENAPKA